MNILVGAAAGLSTGARSRIRELAQICALLSREGYSFTFVVHPALRATVRQHAPQAHILSPPMPFRKGLPRLLWECAILPFVARSQKTVLVIAPFGIAPAIWFSPRPKLITIVSNLAPYSPDVISRYMGLQALRLRTLKRLVDKSLQRADHIFLLSDQAFDLLNARRLAGTVELLPIDPPEPSIARDSPRTTDHEQPYFIVVSDLLRFKGIECAITAIAELSFDWNVKLLICGAETEQHYYKELRRLANDKRVADKVQFLGRQSYEDTLSLLKNARGCVVPSRFENPCRIPVEAMALGTPVLANNIPVFCTVCRDAALYFDVDRPNELSALMRQLLDDGALYKRMSHLAKERLRQITKSRTSAANLLIRALRQRTTDGSRPADRSTTTIAGKD